jgi:hypothetical protein
MEFAQDDIVVLRVRPIDLGRARLRFRWRRADHVRARGARGEAAEEQDIGDNDMAKGVHAVTLAALA